MKKITFLLFIACAIQAIAADYQPLVREGVRWYYQDMYFDGDEGGLMETTPFFFEFKGDSIINGITYKKLYRTYGDHEYMMCLVNEKDHKVYENDEGYTELLYNFTGHTPICHIDIAGQKHAVYEVKCRFSDNMHLLIEGVGLDRKGCWWCNGDFLEEYEVCACIEFSKYRFDRLEDLDGNVLYRAQDYNKLAEGDVTGEGVVDISDANALLNIILSPDFAPRFLGNADVNGDGQVDVSDVNIVINKILEVPGK